jgi:hypothetical protein
MGELLTGGWTFKSEGFNNNGISTEKMYVILELFLLKYSETLKENTCQML